MFKDDKFSCDLITTLKTGSPLEVHGSYMKNYEMDLPTRYDPLFMEKK